MEIASATASVRPAATVGSATTTAAVTAVLRERWVRRDRQSYESSKRNEGFNTKFVHNLSSRSTCRALRYGVHALKNAVGVPIARGNRAIY
jgi:hypothetical protein